LKRRPNHGLEFLAKMREMNRSGLLGITVTHSLKNEVQSLSRFVWQCRECGCLYRRQRRSIQPKRHRCGACRGALREVDSAVHSFSPPAPRGYGPRLPPSQLTLPFLPAHERSRDALPQD
jgi:hypothetical protein